MLALMLAEAEQRKNDPTLPIEVRVRSNETAVLLRRVAHERGIARERNTLGFADDIIIMRGDYQ